MHNFVYNRAIKIDLDLPKPKNKTTSHFLMYFKFQIFPLGDFEIFEHGHSYYDHNRCHASHNMTIL